MLNSYRDYSIIPLQGIDYLTEQVHLLGRVDPLEGLSPEQVDAYIVQAIWSYCNNNTFGLFPTESR